MEDFQNKILPSCFLISKSTFTFQEGKGQSVSQNWKRFRSWNSCTAFESLILNVVHVEKGDQKEAEQQEERHCTG